MAIVIIDNRAVEVEDDFDTGPLYEVRTSEPSLYEQLVGDSDPLVVAVKLADNVNETYYDLGCVLYHLKNTGRYQKLDPKFDKPNHAGWKDFCNEVLTGINYRTAQYWLNIYRYFDSMGIDKQRVVDMGWSKAKELVDFTELPEKLEAALEFAETASIAEVKGYVELNTPDVGTGEDGTQTIKVESFKFFLPEEPSVHIKQIIEDAAKFTEGDTNSAFFKICVEWQMANAAVSYEPTTLNIGD